MSVFEKLSAFDGGRVVLLNFLEGFRAGHFRPTKRLRRLLRQWRNDFSERVCLLPGADLTDILNCLITAYEKTLGDSPLSHIWFKIPARRLGQLVRVIDVYSLVLSDEFGLLKKSLLLTDPTILISGWEDNPNLHRKIEALNGRADAIRVVSRNGSTHPMTVRGRLPLAWATGAELLETRGATGRVEADETRNALALDHDIGVHLYKLIYPTSILRFRIGRRPTFAEANLNRFFRARRETATDRYGRTVDLGSASAESAMIEGLPEIIAGAEPMSAHFRWHYIGRVSTSTPLVRREFFESRLIGTPDIGLACQEAKNLLERLST